MPYFVCLNVPSSCLGTSWYIHKSWHAQPKNRCFHCASYPDSLFPDGSTPIAKWFSALQPAIEMVADPRRFTCYILIGWYHTISCQIPQQELPKVHSVDRWVMTFRWLHPHGLLVDLNHRSPVIWWVYQCPGFFPNKYQVHINSLSFPNLASSCSFPTIGNTRYLEILGDTWKYLVFPKTVCSTCRFGSRQRRSHLFLSPSGCSLVLRHAAATLLGVARVGLQRGVPSETIGVMSMLCPFLELEILWSIVYGQ